MHSVRTLSNNKIKEIIKLHQKKYRDEKGLFIAEGEKSLNEAIESGVEITDIFALASFKLKSKIDIPLTIITEEEMKKISTTASSCEVMICAKQKKYPISEFSNKKRIILLDSISDPGNLGTIIRSAAAFDIDGIILFNDCVELYSPKVIRSSAGNFFKTPVITMKSAEEVNTIFKSHLKVATALSKKNNISIKQLSETEKFIIMFGSEANGLSSNLIKISDKNIILDMKKNVESLNLSISASIILYELFIVRTKIYDKPKVLQSELLSCSEANEPVCGS